MAWVEYVDADTLATIEGVEQHPGRPTQQPTVDRPRPGETAVSRWLVVGVEEWSERRCEVVTYYLRHVRVITPARRRAAKVPRWRCGRTAVANPRGRPPMSRGGFR
jgi:hypothetical protein